MSGRKKNWKDNLAGLKMPPKRAAAKIVAPHHSTEDPIKRAPSVVVDKEADGLSKTMATDLSALPSPASVLQQLSEQSNPGASLDKPTDNGDNNTVPGRKNGNGKAPDKVEKVTAKERPNGKKENGENSKYDVEYTSSDIPGIQIFGTHASIINGDIVIENKPELRNRGAKNYRITLECVDNRINLVSIEPEEVREVIETPIKLFLANKGAHSGSDLSNFKCSYTFGMQLTYPTRDFSEEDIKAPVMRTTSSGKPVKQPIDVEGSSLMKITPVYGIELGNPYKLPDKNGYVFYANDNEYHIRLIGENEFTYKFTLSKRKTDGKEIKPVSEFTFDKSNNEEHAGFSDEKMWLTMTCHKNGERSIAIVKWDPHADKESERSKNRAPKIVTAIVTAASAATLLFLPELADQLREHFNLIKIPESVNIDYLGSVPIRTYLGVPAGIITTMGLFIIKLTGRTKKGDTQ